MYGAVTAFLTVVQSCMLRKMNNHKNCGALACMLCKMNSVDHKNCGAMLCNIDESEVGVITSYYSVV